MCGCVENRQCNHRNRSKEGAGVAVPAVRPPAIRSPGWHGAGGAGAQDATWLQTPADGDLNNAANWSTGTVPSGTAFFGPSNQTGISTTAPFSVGGWTFDAGAADYTFNIAHDAKFTGAGIVINGGSATIVNSDIVTFLNSSTAGDATITNNLILGFLDASTAGNATITNAGAVYFNDTSSAGSATIVNNLELHFVDGSTAGDSTINNNGPIYQTKVDYRFLQDDLASTRAPFL